MEIVDGAYGSDDHVAGGGRLVELEYGNVQMPFSITGFVAVVQTRFSQLHVVNTVIIEHH